MNQIFFTSDLHFDHHNILKFQDRGVKSIQQMNQKIIDNWNSIVGKQDDIYILGDFMWRNQRDNFDKLKRITNSLNGNKYLIRGNHDRYSNFEYMSSGFKQVCDIKNLHLHYNGNVYFFVLCHYAMKFWQKSHFGSYCLYGHQHFKREIDFDLYCKLQMSTRTFNVCLDGNNLFPYSLTQILKQIQNNPINFIQRD